MINTLLFIHKKELLKIPRYYQNTSKIDPIHPILCDTYYL